MASLGSFSRTVPNLDQLREDPNLLAAESARACKISFALAAVAAAGSGIVYRDGRHKIAATLLGGGAALFAIDGAVALANAVNARLNNPNTDIEWN
jgi:hypothetical protein